MEKKRTIGEHNLQLIRAINPSMQLEMFYGESFSKIKLAEPIEPEDMTDSEAEQRLLKLADDIMKGTINSHADIARTIRSLGPKIGGPIASVSTEVHLAAFRLSYAILRRQSGFTEMQAHPRAPRRRNSFATSY